MDMKLVEVQATEIRETLRTMADPAREPGVQRFFKDRVKSLGIGTPALRKLSQEYAKAHRKSLGLDGTLAIGDRLIRCELLEEKTMAVLLAERFAGRLQPAHFAVFDRWIDYADNWATIDGICCTTIGKIILRNGPLMDDLLSWAGDGNLWRRRAAAVSLVVSARRGMYLDETFRVADRLMADREEMVQKGVGWLLKEQSAHYPNEVVDYLKRWTASTSRLVLRYASEKLPPERRKEVLGYRPEGAQPS